MTTIIDADELASGAYEHDARLKDVVIPDNVTQIGKYAFSGCSNLSGKCD